MTYEEAMAAMAVFEGRPVEIDLIVTKVATPPDEHPEYAGSADRVNRDPMVGMVRRMHPSEIDEFWWTLPPTTWFAIEPGRRLVVAKSRFRGAIWERGALILGFGGHVRRVNPMVRADALETLAAVCASASTAATTIEPDG